MRQMLDAAYSPMLPPTALFAMLAAADHVFANASYAYFSTGIERPLHMRMLVMREDVTFYVTLIAAAFYAMQT